MSGDALTTAQARTHLGDIASALRTINGRAEELVEAIEDRDETIARLTAELAEARATVREYFAAIEHDAPITVAYLHRCEAARAALRRLIEGDP